MPTPILLRSKPHSLFPNPEVFIGSGFGLRHGMAFASSFSGLNLQVGPMILSIMGFNIGIEIMQLFIIVLIMPWLILMSMTPYYNWFNNALATATSVAALA